MKLLPIVPPPGTPDEIMWLVEAINKNFQDIEQLTRRGLRAPLGQPGLPSIGFQNQGFDGIGASGMQDGITGAVQGILWESNVIRQRAVSPLSGAASEVVPNGVPDAGGTPARVSALETDVQADPENYSRVEMVAGTDMKVESYKRGTATLRDLVLGVDDGTFTESLRLSKNGTITKNSFAFPVVSTAVGITLDATHHTVLVDASGAARTIALPAAATVSGREYVVKKTDASANAVIIDPAGAELIDGAATHSMTTQWESVQIQSNGTSWFIIADPLAGAAGAAHPLLDGVQNNDTVAQTPTKGSLIVGNATPAWDELLVGATDGDVLTVKSSASVGMSWQTPSTSFPYDPGTLTVADLNYKVMAAHLVLSGTERLTLSGNARLTIV